MSEQRSEDGRVFTPWGVPYYGPVEHGPGDLLWFWHEGKRYPLRPETAHV